MIQKITKTNDGISLIVLAITIIVILMLSGVSISMLSGEKAILSQAENAKEEHVETTIKEEAAIIYADWCTKNKLGQLEEKISAGEYVDNELRRKNYPEELIAKLYATNSKTAKEVIEEIKVGWNLGNTLDCCNYKKEYLGQDKAIVYYETFWKNPQTTKQMIDEIKKAGFNSIRVPVTYYDHIDENGIIDEKWFQRVEEVVNYVLDNDMYCIMDVHHDTGLCGYGSWIVADADKYEENAEKLSGLWTQIATRFKYYDYKLIFEGFNEIVDTNKDYNWTTGHQNTLNVNNLNQVFIDTVRETGGRNQDRFLAVSTFGSIVDKHKLSNFVMPQDKVEDKVLLSLHAYYASEQYDTKTEIDKFLVRIKEYCIDKDIPVMLTEFGTKKTYGDEDERAYIANYYVLNAKKIGIPCFWWDDGSNYILFNRRNLNWEYEKIKDAIISGSNMQAIY